SKRKEILASILNLSIYDQLAEKAKENRNLKLQEHLRVKDVMENNRKYLEKKEAHLQQKGLIEQSLQQSGLEMDNLRAGLEKARDGLQKLEIKETQARHLKDNLVRLKKDEATCYSRVERHRQRISQFLQLINTKSDIEKSFSIYLSVRAQEKSLSEKSSILMQLREKKGNLQRIAEKEESELKQARSHQIRTVQELESKAARKADLVKKSEELQKKAIIIQKQAQELEEKANQQSTCRERIASGLADQKRLSLLLKDLRDKASLIKKGDDKCPLCGSALGQDGLMHVEEHYRDEMQAAGNSLKEMDGKVRSDSGRLEALSYEIKEMEKKLESEKRRYMTEESLQQKALQEVEEAESKLPVEKASLEALTRRLETGDYAGEQKLAMLQLDKDMKDIGYDEEVHRALRKNLSELEDFQKEKFLLDEAEKEMEREKAEEEQAQNELKEKSNQIRLDDAKLRELNQDLSSLPEIKARVDRLAKSLENKEQEKGNMLQQLGGLEENLKGCLDKEKENERLDLERAMSEHEIKIYDGLAEAFGKKGVQALIIETSLPEISSEANDLLARLTDGRMSLQLEMRPESPGGKITESLEIKIADELGTRNYEMFSGGEAFRIDFALRIALSRFLARRAGAPLSLLIIDEGFGSQDETGKEKLIEALNYIQNDFDKILVITHLPELKEYFPYRINVTKTEEGSTISLEES
ncbi:MAG: SMC family ATPase, partial [Candidatus Tectomicrobia bacterium]|nr:SMC family ATPase [Candidatus Tectomicrobia bacterium]